MVKWFIPDKPCKNGHLEKRYTSTGICYACKRGQMRRDYRLHKERHKRINDASSKRHWGTRLAASRRWYFNNKEKGLAVKKAWKQRNWESYLQACREYMRRKRRDPDWRLSKNISVAIWKVLKKKKAAKHWESVVAFTFAELKEHLEKQFVDGMTWDNYGAYWHVDHVRPLSWFDLKKEFKAAWSLQNLQPLLTAHNLSKGARYQGGYDNAFQSVPNSRTHNGDLP